MGIPKGYQKRASNKLPGLFVQVEKGTIVHGMLMSHHDVTIKNTSRSLFSIRLSEPVPVYDVELKDRRMARADEIVSLDERSGYGDVFRDCLSQDNAQLVWLEFVDKGQTSDNRSFWNVEVGVKDSGLRASEVPF